MKNDIEFQRKLHFLLGSFFEEKYLLHASVFKRGQMGGMLNIIKDTNEGGNHGTNCMGNR